MKKRSLAAARIACAAVCITAAGVSSARADGSLAPYGRGGMRFYQMDSIISQYDKTGETFRIEGTCRSSCTELLAIKHICIDPGATLEFHAALASPDQPVDPARNRQMASHYNARLRSFVLANHYMDSWDLHPISGQDMIQKFGYRACS